MLLRNLTRTPLSKHLLSESKRCCTRPAAANHSTVYRSRDRSQPITAQYTGHVTGARCTRHSVSTTPTARHLHYVMQRDTAAPLPLNRVFIMTPDTPPILPCLDYRECAEKLQALEKQLVNATFVVNGVREEGSGKMRVFRGSTLLPTQLQDMSILAICDSDQHEEAAATGASLCLTQEQVEQLNTGEVDIEDYNVVVCTPKALNVLRSLGPLLKQKMPHERKGSVSANINTAIRHSLCMLEWESTDAPNHADYYHVHVPVTMSTHGEQRLEENVTLLFDDIMKYKPAKQNVDRYIERVELATSAGLLHVDIRALQHKHAQQTAVSVVQKSYTREETWELRAAAKLKQGKITTEKDKISESLASRWERLEQGYEQ